MGWNPEHLPRARSYLRTGNRPTPACSAWQWLAFQWRHFRWPRAVTRPRRRLEREINQSLFPQITRRNIFFLRLELDRMRSIKWVEKLEFVHRRKLLVSERGEVIPNMTSLCVRCERARRIRFDFCEWIASVVQALFGRALKNGMLARVANFERSLRRETDQAL
jgi:hypothetical protein